MLKIGEKDITEIKNIAMRIFHDTYKFNSYGPQEIRFEIIVRAVILYINEKDKNIAIEWTENANKT